MSKPDKKSTEQNKKATAKQDKDKNNQSSQRHNQQAAHGEMPHAADTQSEFTHEALRTQKQ